uniref:Uncharacterized protein n=2 Tax=Ciona intestinalis TaxID=7719 RepID=F6YKM4_CIOIN
MLSSDMLKFAEPIGPGQIVDRQSLVSMPSGYAKILLSKQEQEVSIRVITFEERYNSKESVLKTSSKVFLALGTQVVEAEERFILAQDDNEPVSKKWIHVLDRNRLKSDKTTNEILQVCVFSSVSLGGGNKTLIGMVHIAFEEIQRMLPVPSNKFVTSGWYKV